MAKSVVLSRRKADCMSNGVMSEGAERMPPEIGML